MASRWLGTEPDLSEVVVAGSTEPYAAEEVQSKLATVDSLKSLKRNLGSKIAELEKRVMLLEANSGIPENGPEPFRRESSSSAGGAPGSSPGSLRGAAEGPSLQIPDRKYGATMSPSSSGAQRDPPGSRPPDSTRGSSEGVASRTSRASRASSGDDAEAVSEITISMWDAGLLLFFNENTTLDKVTLVAGIVLNFLLQVQMFLVITYNLIDNDFTIETIGEMLTWRVQHGHGGANFDAPEGRSYAARLCAHELWTFEGEKYEDMYSYLYRPVPGVVLSILAIILWIVTTMAEYRKAVSQLLSLIHLPRQQPGGPCLIEDQNGDLRVCGISTPALFAAISCLCVPRLLIAIFLMLVGSKYLAQTVTPADIILNSVTLAFVMDIDEYLARVTLTEKLTALVGKIQPLRCSRHHAPFYVRDVVRYVVIVGTFIFVLGYWVLPFSESVAAASVALCGGELGFSYVGGTALSPNITLMPVTRIFDEYQATCPADVNRTYQGEYYPGYAQPGAEPGGTPGRAEAKWSGDELLLQVVRYAFSADGCGPGMVRLPPRDGFSYRNLFAQVFHEEAGRDEEPGAGGAACSALPATLRAVLPPGVHPGEDPEVAECPRFDASLGADACAEPEQPGVCIWTWEALNCESAWPPGAVFQSACRSSLWQMCETWEGGFNASHPTKNCEVVRQCPRELPRCLGMEGWVDIAVSDASALAALAGPSPAGPPIEMALQEHFFEAFRAAVQVPDPWRRADAYVLVGGTGRQDLMRMGAEGHRCDNSCPQAFNGRCDMPIPCAPGTDWHDCSECFFDCMDFEWPPGRLFVERCANYYGHPTECGLYDHENFTAGEMCCECGGGMRRDRYDAACMDQGTNCVRAFFRLHGMSEDLRREDVLGANKSIAARMGSAMSTMTYLGPELRVLHARFDEASVRFFSSAPGGAD